MEKFGFVGMLDFLGISSLDIKQGKEFIQKRRELIDLSKEKFSEESIRLSFGLKADQPIPGAPEIQMFGDTVLFNLPVEKNSLEEYHLPVCAWWLSFFLHWAFYKGYLIRGALAIGDYASDSYENSYAIVGPAISDARAWYEEADWAGIIVTPSCQFLLESHMAHASINSTMRHINFEEWLVEYDVPLKNKEKRSLWAVAWPHDFLDIAKKNKQILIPPVGILSGLLWKEILSKKPVPKGIESKYTNTVEFFKWYESCIYPKVKADRRNSSDE